MHNAVLRTLGPLGVPAVVLVAAWLLLPHAAAMPEGVRTWMPWGVLLLGAMLAAAFSRGRVFFALCTLALAYLGARQWMTGGLASWPARTVYTAMCVFVPVNLTLFAIFRERGIFNGHGGNKALLIALQVIVVAWIGLERQAVPLELVAQPFLPAWLAGGTPIPHAGLVLLALAFAVVLAKALLSRSPIDISVAGALYAFGAAADAAARPDAFATFLLAAALILTIGLLQDSYRMAFRDELTGLPSRRALGERMLGLGRRFAIAMVDVDHFKKFNDTYGHDVGDQVLRMVAAKIREVGGGGRPYRYGGEEFTIVFPRQSLEEVLPHLEALRTSIEDYRMAIRSPDRPKRTRTGKRRRASTGKAPREVSVTVSIGAAHHTERLDTPEKVIKSADKALYRAKKAGRNRVAR
ncbi:MAG: GGDEF domain-containing protein [Betaproteobacteria bacterium]|nr:GGDEF domain-containing protein [Betaproteobacteria bacterium]